MLIVKTTIRNTAIHEKGLFTSQAIEKGGIIGFLGHMAKVMKETEYLAEIEKEDEIFLKTSVN